MKEIVDLLFENSDEAYASFQGPLIPNIRQSSVIGVRTPVLKKLAKEIQSKPYCEDFLKELPHKYFDENQLHGFIISDIKDFPTCIKLVDAFLPFVDNWATCDQTSPAVFKKHKEELLPYINRWLTSSHTYTVRFAIGMLMKHFLDDDFKPDYLMQVAGIRSEEYYINMEIAWFLATALAKQWDSTIPLIETKSLSKWVQNRTIQKARESFRITAEQKEYLKSLKL